MLKSNYKATSILSDGSSPGLIRDTVAYPFSTNIQDDGTVLRIEISVVDEVSLFPKLWWQI